MRISYLSTHYPLVSHTFIQREIIALEARGIEVFPIALNQAHDAELLSALDHREAERTFYVKGLARHRIATQLVVTALRHPAATVRGLRRAHAAHGGTASKRMLQFLEAVLVWRWGARHDVSGIHAHFGQAPATVARFAAAFGRDVGSGPSTWSATMHGWQEFATEDSSDLPAKLADAEFVVGVSDFTHAQLMRLSEPSRWDRLAVVRCGLALGDFPERPPRALPAVPVIVTTARLSPEKGHLVLIEALARLRDEGVTMHARCIGSGPFRSTIESAVRSAGLDSQITFTGPLAPADVAAELRDADIFCLPTFAEGLPVAIMEAMAVGVPVVTTYISGIPELVEDGVSGFVVPAANAERLAAKLRAVTTCPDLPDVIAEARRRVERNHDITHVSAQLADLLSRHHGAPEPRTA